MQKSLTIVVVTAALLVGCSVVVFAVALDLSLVDALYFAVTTVTTVGYGDISLKDAPASVKLFGVVVMVAGPAAMAAGFGIVTDVLLRRRLEVLLGRKQKRRMKDHIVLCGVGNVGVRVLERCVDLGEPVVVVEKNEDRRFLARARELDVPIVIGDMRQAETLEQAQVGEAKSIIACTQDDLANLEAALLARSVAPEIRVVLRMFNQSLARRLEDNLGITTALSTSMLAAPAFAMAALDDCVIGSFDVDGLLMLTLRVSVEADHPWAGTSVLDAAQQARGAVLVREHGQTKDTPPDPQTVLQAGDRVVVCVPAEHRDRVPTRG